MMKMIIDIIDYLRESIFMTLLSLNYLSGNLFELNPIGACLMITYLQCFFVDYYRYCANLSS